MINYEILKLLRIKDWLKNILIFIPLIFSGHLINFNYYYDLIYSFLVFCLISSSIYVLNDIIDVKSDKNNPLKKNIIACNSNIHNELYDLISK